MVRNPRLRWLDQLCHALVLGVIHFGITHAIGFFLGIFALGRPRTGTLIHDIWFWAMALPVKLVETLGWASWVSGDGWMAMYAVNSILYGGMWWFVWRMWTLMRAKPAE